MPNKAKVSDVYGITVEVEGESSDVELLAAASAEFERLTALTGKGRTVAGSGFTTGLPTPRQTAPARRGQRAERLPHYSEVGPDEPMPPAVRFDAV